MNKFSEHALISRTDRILQGMKEKNEIPNYAVPAWANDSKKYNSVTAKKINVDKKERFAYTGDLIIGIATMHKSNAVPVTNKDHAVDIAKMRR